MLDCRSLINDFLDDYLAGRLPVGKLAEFKLHLAMCYQCRRYVASYKQTMKLAKAAEAAETRPPEELVNLILRLRPRAG